MIFYGSEPMVFTNFIYFTKLKDFKMEIVQIIVSIITLIGVLSASIFSFLATRSSNKFAKTSKYIDVITSQRILWLDKIRDDTADMISSMKQFASEDIILESENEKYYIVTNGLTIFKNNHEPSATTTIYVRDEDGITLPDFQSYGELLFDDDEPLDIK